MPLTTRLRKVLLPVALILILACTGFPATATPRPINTLGPLDPLAPTTELVGQYRPSPGGWIAFLKDGNLWMVHPDGSGLKQITRDPAPDLRLGWSADGQLLAYTHSGTLSILHMAGLGTNVIASDTAGGFDWSSTAHELIYDTALTSPPGRLAANGGLRVISTEGSTTRNLTTPAYPAMLDPLWSFDSRSVIFTTPDAPGPHLLDAATGIVTDLLPGASKDAACSWSPVELLIACLDGSQTAGVLILDRYGKQQRSLPLPAAHYRARLGPWSPDGGSLAITYTTAPDSPHQASDILSLDTGKFTSLGPGTIATWSPDARWVILAGTSPDSQALTVVNTTSGLVSPLADGVSPTWQPAAADPLTAATGGTPVPGSDDYCLDASAGFVHKHPKGYYLQFCIGAEKYNYGALAGGVYIVGAQTRYFVYAGNNGFAYAARMGDPTLTRIGDFRWFRIFNIASDPDPKLELRFITGYPALVQVFELRFNQKDTFTLPHRIYAP